MLITLSGIFFATEMEQPRCKAVPSEKQLIRKQQHWRRKLLMKEDRFIRSNALHKQIIQPIEETMQLQTSLQLILKTLY